EQIADLEEHGIGLHLLGEPLEVSDRELRDPHADRGRELCADPSCRLARGARAGEGLAFEDDDPAHAPAAQLISDRGANASGSHDHDGRTLAKGFAHPLSLKSTADPHRSWATAQSTPRRDVRARSRSDEAAAVRPPPLRLRASVRFPDARAPAAPRRSW